MKKISIVVYDLSDNTLARVYPIASILSKRYKVEVIGPILGEDIYKPYKYTFEYTSYHFRRDKNRFLEFIHFAYWFYNNINSDLLFVFKPRVTSLGLASVVKFIKKIPIILDIDDFETASFYEKNAIYDRIYTLLKHKSLNESIFLNLLIERLISYSDKIFVSSSFLQKRYGGNILCHGADDSIFDPNKFPKLQTRMLLGIKNDEIIILFSGVVRAHKGLDTLLEAIKLLNLTYLKLMIVGFDHGNVDCKYLISKYSSFIIPVQQVDHSEIPLYLAASDIVVLLQKDTIFSNAQIPAKVFEAMSMGKTIIASDVSDLSIILGDHRFIINPDIDPKKLAEKINYIIKNISNLSFFSDFIRSRHSAFYSWKAMENILTSVLSTLKF